MSEKKPHRTTVYLTTSHHTLVQEQDMNLSEFLRDMLDEFFNKPELIEEKLRCKELELRRIKTKKSELRANEKEIIKLINKLKKELLLLKKRNELRKGLNLSKKEFNFLKDCHERRQKGRNLIPSFKDYRLNFGDLKYDEFIDRLKLFGETVQ